MARNFATMELTFDAHDAVIGRAGATYPNRMRLRAIQRS